MICMKVSHIIVTIDIRQSMQYGYYVGNLYVNILKIFHWIIFTAGWTFRQGFFLLLEIPCTGITFFIIFRFKFWKVALLTFLFNFFHIIQFSYIYYFTCVCVFVYACVWDTHSYVCTWYMCLYIYICGWWRKKNDWFYASLDFLSFNFKHFPCRVSDIYQL